MLVSYKRKNYLLVSVLIILIDGIISYFMDNYINHLNYFYPMLTISLIPFLFDNNYKEYYRLSFIIGIIYDLLYSNIFLFNAFLFLILSKIDSKIMNIWEDNFFLYCILVIINIIIYDTILFVLIYLTKYSSVYIYDLFYKISHSLLLNIMSVFVYYFYFKKRNLKHNM